jgi:hypothetical protein
VKGKRSKQQTVNRILGFSGRPTDAEIDEVLELVVRMFMRVMTRSDVLDLVETAKTFQQFGRA